MGYPEQHPSVSPTSLKVDNQGAIDLAYNPEHHQKTKHIERRHFYVRELVEQLACVVETLGQGAPTSGGPDDDDAKKKKKKKTENPDEEPVGSSSARISDDYSGAWRGFKTVVPKEGRCDGAVGASMAVFSAILHHPFQSKTLEEHPGFDGVWNAVTRALGSRCSCAFATFSTAVSYTHLTLPTILRV